MNDVILVSSEQKSVVMVPVEAVKVDLVTKAEHTIFVPLADANNYGVVKIGDGLNISSGIVSVDSDFVLDMIDSAEYVSYTKKQNLTEEQKRTARDNINVGDYEDLLGLPTLNTTISTSQPIVSNEILSGEIKLHKVSKTGDYGDLLNRLELSTDAEAAAGTIRNKAITPHQLKVAIDSIGTVFDLKGSVSTKSALPMSGNEIGDVWYVKDESVGYVWLNDGGTNRWEKLGESIDTSVFVKFTDMDNEVIDSITNNATPLTDSQKRAVYDWLSVASVSYVDEQIGTINTALEAVLGV